MKRIFSILLPFLALPLLFSGCAHKNVPDEAHIERQGEKFRNLPRSRAIDVVDEPYLGARAVPLSSDESSLGARITLRKKGALGDMATAISSLTPLKVLINAVDPDPLEKKPASSAGAGAPGPLGLELPDITAALSSGAPGPAKTLSVAYDGPLRGLLDTLAIQSGFGWDYDARSNTVVFARLMVRTFTLIGAPGKVSYDNQITNKSKESNSGTLGSSSRVNQTVSTQDTSAQTAQTNKTELKFDVWEDTEKVVKSLLSKGGSVVGNQAAGTLTVRDRPENIRQVAAFIRDVNERLGRQVALNVQVWALEISDESEANLDLQVLFSNSDISVVAGSLASLGGLNTATATIVSGKLKNSTGVLKALKQWGRATQVTSGGGLVMSNQPVPVLAVKRHAYLAGAAISQNDYGQTNEITPGEVTSGFAMTVIPHILDKRRLVLQYNINLSSLDSMEEFKTEGLTVQLPQVSTRAFSQRTRMQMGQTLVLAGFQQESQSADNGVGFITLGRKAKYGKTLLVITIEVESADIGGAETEI